MERRLAGAGLYEVATGNGILRGRKLAYNSYWTDANHPEDAIDVWYDAAGVVRGFTLIARNEHDRIFFESRIPSVANELKQTFMEYSVAPQQQSIDSNSRPLSSKEWASVVVGKSSCYEGPVFDLLTPIMSELQWEERLVASPLDKDNINKRPALMSDRYVRSGWKATIRCDEETSFYREGDNIRVRSEIILWNFD